jgi:hypothetical protein
LYDLDPAERQPTYADIAAELLIPVTSVTNHLSASRRRFRQIAMEKLRQLTATDREYRSEVRAIFGTPAA